MREYTTIPNVYRLAPLPSISGIHSNDSNNFNLNNNHSRNNDNHATEIQQSMIVTTTIPTMATTTTPTTATTTQAIVHNRSENVIVNDGAGSENVAIRINYPHKLKTIASIERHYNDSDIQNVEQRKENSSSYATLARGTSLNNDNNHLGIIANGNLVRLKMSTNQKPISSQATDDERIISTISGSIPSTGIYTGNITTTNNNNNNHNNTSNSLDQSSSLVSDLNISFTDLSQLNSVEQQQHLMSLRDYRLLNSEQQEQQQQQQHYDPSRHLSHKSTFHVGFDRRNDSNNNNNNNYLWILTPVAAR